MSTAAKALSLPHQRCVVYVVREMKVLNANALQKYYLVVMLVEITTVDELVERLKKGKFRSYDDTKAKS